MSNEDLESGVFIGEHNYCIAKEFPKTASGSDRKPCESSDAFAIYEKELPDGGVVYDGFCWSCRQQFSTKEVHSSSHAEMLGVEPESGAIKERVNFANKASKKEKITREERDDLWSRTSFEGKSYRNHSDEVNKFYGHRFEYDKDGKVIATYYPETSDGGKLQGYKSRHLPKNFGYGNVGRTGSCNELSGQHKFPNGGKYCLLVGGEEDKAAAQIMLMDYQRQKGYDDMNPYSVVSPTTGEPTAPKQCREQYEWFDKHDIIIIGLDNDEAGNDAALEVAKVLPKDKVRIAQWSEKDPDTMLDKRKQRQFLRDFFDAKPVEKSSIQTSLDMMDAIYEELSMQRLSLPTYMKKVVDMTKGGFLQGRIINIIGPTSVGKTTFSNGFVYHWMFNEMEKGIGAVSLEATTGQYGLDLLSLHLKKNIQWIGDNEDIKLYLKEEDVQEEANMLWADEFGKPRMAILDERDSSIKGLERQMERLVKQFDCQIIIVDVLTDILRGAPMEQQEDHLKWQKAFVKSGATIVNVLHTKKLEPRRDGIPTKATEYDALGTSSFVQSAAINLVINRNKMAKCPIERNTTYVDMPKCRGGDTGFAGAWYYDTETREVYDRDEFFANNPEKLPEGVDLSISSFDREYYPHLMQDGKNKSRSSHSSPSTIDTMPIKVGDFEIEL